MVRKRRKTGEILPRAYGIRISMPRGIEDVFVSPAPYILAQLMLETRSEIRARIKDYAERNKVDETELTEEFVEKVKKRNGSKNILNFSRRTRTRRSNLALEGLTHRGSRFSGSVKSTEEGSYLFTIPEPPAFRDTPIGFPGAWVNTKDKIYSEEKGKMVVVGTHLAVPEIALITDEQTKMSQSENMTGLYPTQRQMRSPMPVLPFTFNIFKNLERMTDKERERHSLITDLIMRHYINGATQYEISVEALNHTELLSPELISAIKNPRDRARFKVLRQKEKEFIEGSLTDSEERRYAAITNLVENISTYLKETHGYIPTGYGREFVGTPWEAIARRFEPPRESTSGLVYSIVTSEGHVPLIIKKQLGNKSHNWQDVNDPMQTLHIAHKIDRTYDIVDDMTRQDCAVTLPSPDKKLRELGIQIPQILQKDYDELRKIRQ
ncbi:hypothetical protein COU60_02255 [Candidatus Pacearchaeota archaeon CG10_big_fil_rev_8_21_14_0_10_34_76]|nr:MAG: hypothetical protein COU60_02255 [Candidatus Pacearchaeota archaeon CG10_big_fil_rev_8_21_14_0_10_34_76]